MNLILFVIILIWEKLLKTNFWFPISLFLLSDILLQFQKLIKNCWIWTLLFFQPFQTNINDLFQLFYTVGLKIRRNSASVQQNWMQMIKFICVSNNKFLQSILQRLTSHKVQISIVFDNFIHFIVMDFKEPHVNFI